MKKLRNFLRDNHGVVMIEFAFIFPILLLLTFPTIDYARYILLQQKVIKAAYVFGDAVTMSRPIEADTKASDIAADSTYLTEALLNDPSGPDLVDTLPRLMLPFEEKSGQNMWQAIITHVRKPPGGSPEVTWQYNEDTRDFTATAYSSGNTHGSRIASGSGFNRHDPAALPTELLNSMGDNEELIAVEVTAHHKPITPLMGVINIPFVNETDMHYTSYMRTRYGSLQYMWSNNCPPTNVNCP